MFENRFYKVSERGGSYVVAVLFNPITFEEKTETIYDDDRFSPIINKEVYYLPIDEDVKKLYLHFKGNIFIGDLVKIIKGRKMLNETKRVVKTFNYRVYKGFDIEYLVFEDNTKVQAENCQLIQEYERYNK